MHFYRVSSKPVINIDIYFAEKKEEKKEAGFAVPHSSWTIGWLGIGVGMRLGLKFGS